MTDTQLTALDQAISRAHELDAEITGTSVDTWWRIRTVRSELADIYARAQDVCMQLDARMARLMQANLDMIGAVMDRVEKTSAATVDVVYGGGIVDIPTDIEKRVALVEDIVYTMRDRLVRDIAQRARIDELLIELQENNSTYTERISRLIGTWQIILAGER